MMASSNSSTSQRPTFPPAARYAFEEYLATSSNRLTVRYDKCDIGSEMDRIE